MLSNDDYKIDKAILWFIVDNERMPNIEDLSAKLNMPLSQIKPRLLPSRTRRINSKPGKRD